jgi:gliding motility-associated-like protein
MRPLSILSTLLVSAGAQAQCGAVVGTFPYQEGFEAGPAWLTGGASNDWAWGTPVKPVINSAGGGTQSWVVGGLTGSFYNYGEQSWLEGPCFDFTALPYPYVSFKIFWECERTYDGLGFQYSLDQGNSWQNVGSVNDPPTCFDQNWFNTPNINNLNLASPKHGWSGRVGTTLGSCAGGQGSTGWVTASHCLSFLAGEPSVKFRFVFGAGTTCNSYDGIAIDDVYIGEAPAEPVGLQYECFANELEIQDSQTCADSMLWDFGDPASGVANTSTLPTPSHSFSGPGQYSVTYTRFFACRSPISTTLAINVVDLQITTTDPTCAGNDGTANAVVTGSTEPPTYSWTGNGVNATTSSITGLSSGTYNLYVYAGGTCPTGASVTLAPPPNAPQLAITSTDVLCHGESSGSATVSINSGTPGFTINWAPQGGTGATASNLPAGNYTCTVTDAQQCSAQASVTITQPPELVVTAQDDLPICDGDEATLTVDASGGTPALSFSWSPNGPLVSPSTSTTYTVLVTDANGCTSSDEVSVIVGSVSQPRFTVQDTIGCAPHCATFISEDEGELIYDFGDGSIGAGGASTVHCYNGSGTFEVTLTVTNDQGCAGSWTLEDAVHVLQTPMASFFADPPVTTIKFPDVRLINTSAGADSVWWTIGFGADSIITDYDALFRFDSVGCYPVRLRVMSANGCTAETGYTLCVEDEFAAYIPNAFTPNGDGFNDFWGVITTVGEPREFELLVFDRWGGVLFQATEKGQFWDGESGGETPIGTYPWLLRLRDTGGRVQERAGHVTLLR